MKIRDFGGKVEFGLSKMEWRMNVEELRLISIDFQIGNGVLSSRLR